VGRDLGGTGAAVQERTARDGDRLDDERLEGDLEVNGLQTRNFSSCWSARSSLNLILPVMDDLMHKVRWGGYGRVPL